MAALNNCVDLLPLGCSGVSLAVPLYSISHHNPFRKHLLRTVNNDVLLSHSSLRACLYGSRAGPLSETAR